MRMLRPARSFHARSAGNWVSGNMGTGGDESQDSALASYCAADQDKFWEMRDALFTNNRDGEEQGSFARGVCSRSQRARASTCLPSTPASPPASTRTR